MLYLMLQFMGVLRRAVSPYDARLTQNAIRPLNVLLIFCEAIREV